MKKRDLINLRKEEKSKILKLLEDKKKELSKSSIDVMAAKEKNVKKPGNIKRDIAQLLTFLKEREILSRVEKDKK